MAQHVQPQILANGAGMWQFEENDGSWVDFDKAVSDTIEKSPVSTVVQCSTAQFNYSITKTAVDTGFQQNTSTNKKRKVRRSIVAICDWQFKDEHDQWKDCSAEISAKIEALNDSAQTMIETKKFKYVVTRIDRNSAKQSNTKTLTARQLRRKTNISIAVASNDSDSSDDDDIIISDNSNVSNIVMWQFFENDGSYRDLGSPNSTKIEQSSINATIQLQSPQFTYDVLRQTTDDAQSTNTKTTKVRALRRILIDPSVDKRVVWQFCDDKKQWITIYNTALCQKIESLSNGTTTNYNIGSHTYVVKKRNATTAKQTNAKYNTVRQLRRTVIDKMKADPKQSVQPTMIGTDPNASDNDIAMANDINQSLKNVDTSFAERLFKQSMGNSTIIQVTKLQPPKAKVYFAMLAMLKKEWKKSTPVDRWLFHGTSHINVDQILKYGFNRSFTKRALYGKGVYFGGSAQVSDGYSTQNSNGEKVMLLCKVAVGLYCIGQQSMDVPPLNPDQSGPYDTMVDNLSDPSIFVVPTDYQALPIFKIEYK